LQVLAEISKKGILVALLLENLVDGDIFPVKRLGEVVDYIQVKSLHTDRGSKFTIVKKRY
jgi:hypothetical protein